MDAPTKVPEQNSEGDQKPSELRIQVDKGHPKDVSDGKPRQVSREYPIQYQVLWLNTGPPQLETDQKETMMIEYVQRILATLASLERDDPKLAIQAA
jgi:hypothetical protein